MTNSGESHDGDTLIATSDAGVTGVRGEKAAPVSRVPATIAGRYEILGMLGVGGMGCVYKARDCELDEVIALKMLRRELMSRADTVERFRREVKLARKVTHRNVARTFDLGEHEGEKYLTMEFVEGESLAARIAREGPLLLSEVIRIAMAIGAGLAAAHGAGVIHRDLKPDNVLLGVDGRVVITDFGIARSESVAGVQARQTSGMPIGTPLYMAPEQVEGSRSLDARADLYAFGAMLFELITGSPPWEGETVVAIMLARLVRDPPDVRERRTDVPDALADVVRRCMARAPDDRPANADEVLGKLASVSVGHDLAAPSQRASAPPLSPPLAGPTAAPTEKTVAVLPFRNAGAADDAYIADGLTEDLIDTLTMTKGLRVRSRGAVLKYRGREEDPRDIGHELGVQVVVEGSVRRVRGAVRVSARVVGVDDGFQLWAQRFDRPESDTLLVSDEVARDLARVLLVESNAPRRAAPENAEAIELYLRGRAVFRSYEPASFDEALRLIERARALAPDDPSILTAYATVQVRRYFLTTEQHDTGLDLAREAAEHALRVAPHLGEPQLALARIALHSGHPDRAATHLRRALEAAPGLADAHELAGSILTEVGLFDEAERRVRMAISLDPGSINPYVDFARLCALRGEFERAESQLDQAAKAGGELANAWLARTRARLAAWKGDLDRVTDLLRAVVAQEAGPSVADSIAQSGIAQSDARQAIVRSTIGQSGASIRRRALATQIEAEVAATAKDLPGAIDAMQRSVSGGLFDVAWMDFCPVLEPLRSLPEFQDLRSVVAARATRVADAWHSA